MLGLTRLALSVGCGVLGVWALPTIAAAAEPVAPAAAGSDRSHSDAVELERFVELYLSGQYEACVDALTPLVTPGSTHTFTDPSVLERGRLYLASCASLSGRNEEARGVLRAALESNPLMPPPDSLTFPPPVLALFLEVREDIQGLITKQEQEQVARLLRENEEARLREAQRAAREAELRRLAEEQPIIARNSRWVASLPFGAGQFQNGNEALGVTFLASETALALGAVVSATVLMNVYASGGLNADGNIPPGQEARFEVPNAFLTATSIGLVSVMALGILEAHLAFQPERQLGTRHRTLPPRLTEGAGSSRSAEQTGHLEPWGSAGPDGGWLGVRGSF
ncbi:MAG TPA: hypothetical protein VLC09_03240 [Polyangiaceae bacterium]|nr:hypothetical protein [Polyangiaceae bacterium]